MQMEYYNLQLSGCRELVGGEYLEGEHEQPMTGRMAAGGLY